MQRLRADDTAVFRSKLETEAAGLLLECLRGGEPIVVMTGPAGVGKTAVVDAALEALGPGDPRVLRLQAPFPALLAVQEQFAALLDLQGPQAASPADIAQALLLMAPPAPGVSAVAVIIDGAEAAPLPVLQYLWLMHSLTCLGRPAMQLVMVGRDAVWRLLAEDALAGLRRGITSRLAMQPFADDEARAFLQFLLRQRGRRAETEAEAEIVARGAGVPGRIATLLEASCAGLAAGRPVTLARVRAALGMPPEPAAAGGPAPGWLGRAAIADAAFARLASMRQAFRPQVWASWIAQRPLQAGTVAAGCVVLIAGWQLLAGGGARPARTPAPPRIAVNAPPPVPPAPPLSPVRAAVATAGPPGVPITVPRPVPRLAPLPAVVVQVAPATLPWRYAPLVAALTPARSTAPLDMAAFLPKPIEPRPAIRLQPQALQPAATQQTATQQTAAQQAAVRLLPIGPAVRVLLAPVPPPVPLALPSALPAAETGVAGAGARVPAPAAALNPRPPPARPSAPMLVMADATAPRIALLYPRGDARAASRARRAAQALRDAGLDAADPVAVIRPSGRAGVGYYFAADRDIAERIARTLAGIAGPAAPEELPEQASPPPPGTIEVLLEGR